MAFGQEGVALDTVSPEAVSPEIPAEPTPKEAVVSQVAPPAETPTVNEDQPAEAAASEKKSTEEKKDEPPPFQVANPPPPLEQLRPNRKYAIFTLSYDSVPLGKIKFKLNWQEMYASVSHFIGLASGTKGFTDLQTGKTVTRPFYDGLTIHRINRGFVAQGGCPFGTGRGNHGHNLLKDEWHPDLKFNTAGVLALSKQMDANSKDIPNSAGSQFFITLAPQPDLNGQAAILGQIVKDDTESRQTLRKLEDIPVNFYSKPVKPLVIESVHIIEE